MSESAIKYKSVTADNLVQPGFSKYHGYLLSAATATAVIEIRAASAAAGGTVIDAIPATTAQGTQRLLPHPIECSTGLFIDFTGTGTLVILYE